MNWTESKIDTVLKMAVCLAMIGSMVGCSGGFRAPWKLKPLTQKQENGVHQCAKAHGY
jgi:hypothetical protein